METANFIKKITKSILEKNNLLVDPPKILVWDLGLGLCHALRLLKDGYDVDYYIAWEDPYPNFEDYIPGDGFGLTKIRDPGLSLPKARYVVFTDVGNGAMAEFLRRFGKSVYGGSAKGELLELDRIYAYKTIRKLGLPVTRHVIVKGVNAVLDHFKKNPGKKFFVKSNIFRGLFESFGTDDFGEAMIEMQKAAKRLGPYADSYLFIVEDELKDMVEIGVDAWFNGSSFLPKHFFTLEVKGMGTIGKWVEKSVWTPIFDKLTTVLDDEYRYSFSIEGFYDGKNIYVTDFCCRPPYPSSAIFPHYIKNYSELITGVAEGKLVDIEVDTLYQCQVSVISDRLERNGDWVRLVYKPGTNIEFRRAVKIGDEIYCAPGDPLAAAIVGSGNTIEECFDDARKSAEKVSVQGMELELGIFAKFKEEYIKPLKDLGLDF